MVLCLFLRHLSWLFFLFFLSQNKFTIKYQRPKRPLEYIFCIYIFILVFNYLRSVDPTSLQCIYKCRTPYLYPRLHISICRHVTLDKIHHFDILNFWSGIPRTSLGNKRVAPFYYVLTVEYSYFISGWMSIIIPADTWRKMTSYLHRCDVVTSYRRLYDVILAPNAHREFIFGYPKILDIRKPK